MKITPLEISGAWLVETKRFADDRGHFQENFKLSTIQAETGFDFRVKQVNQSMSAAGVVRGIHWADAPPGQAKYVTVQAGAIYDVVVDLRESSPTFGHWQGVELSAENGHALLIGNGLGHAFLSLANNTLVTYLCSEEFNAPVERGINPLDPAIGIDFAAQAASLGISTLILSPKDEGAPFLAEVRESGLLPS